MSFSGQGDSGHHVVMDVGPEGGGANGGPRPTELLLMAVGGCTGIDVVSILGKMQVPFTAMEIVVSGTRAPDHPRYFTSVEVVYRVHGENVPVDRVERAAQLSMERYCSVSQTLLGRAVITHRVEVLPPGA